jgi:hypothetical protein
MNQSTRTYHARSAYRRRVSARLARLARAPRVASVDYSPSLLPCLDRARIGLAPQGVASAAAYRVASDHSAAVVDPFRSRLPANSSAPVAPRAQDRLSAPYRSATGTARSAFTGSGSTVTGQTGHGLKSAPRSKPVGWVGIGDSAPSRSLPVGSRSIRTPLPPCASKRQVKRRRWQSAQRYGAEPAINPEQQAERQETKALAASLHSLALSFGPETDTTAAGLTSRETQERTVSKVPAIVVRYNSRTSVERSWRPLRPLLPITR